MKVSLPFSVIGKDMGPENHAKIAVEPTQRLIEIGEKLRQTRERHSFSLDMVAAYTRIRRHILQALEEGKIESLPEPVYIQGLIRQYANALGLDGKELAEYFLPEPISSGQSSWFSPVPQLRPTHLYLTYILLILGTMHGLVYLIKSSPQVQILPDTTIAEAPVTGTAQSLGSAAQTSTPAQQPVAVPAAQTTPTPATPAKPAPVPQTVEVGITVKEESWVLIEIDGQTEFQGILSDGTKRTWKAKQELVVVAGNAGGVIITVNNGESRRLGEPGMVEEVVFKADNPKSQTPQS
ncbi:MAG: RodZ domain-containing protein [Cyanobacteria bacterium J06592_8]